MEKREFTGVDISKSTIDLWLYFGKLHKKFLNTTQGFEKMLVWVKKTTGVKSINEMVFCFENTGLYSTALSIFLDQKGIDFYMLSALMVKRTMGLKRGKTDKVDAKALSRFVYLHRHELIPYKMPSKIIIKLKELLSFRSRLVRQAAAFKAHLSELNHTLDSNTDCSSYSNELIRNSSKELIEIYKQKIKLIEQEILKLISSDKDILNSYKNITAIKAVGMVLASTMIAQTNNFKSFNRWRQFACYSGIAPFEHSSGISLRGRTRISSLGNRDMKTLLSQAAASAIQYNRELMLYYQKRIHEGKNKMSTLNIIRNKLVSRIFAVGKRQSPFIDYFKFAA